MTAMIALVSVLVVLVAALVATGVLMLAAIGRLAAALAQAPE